MRTVALLAAALSLAGCLGSEESVRLFLDGSGRLEQVVVTDEGGRRTLARAFATLYAGDAERESALHADPFDARWIRALAARAPGYRIRKLDRLEDGKGGMRLTLHGIFDDLGSAARGGAFLTASVRLERVEPDIWRLEIKEGWGLFGDEARREIGGVDVEKVKTALAPALAGYRVERTFTLPVKILETNGEVDEEGSTVRWKTDLTRLAEGPAHVSWVTFHRGDELELQPFRYRPDPDLLLRRLLETPPGGRGTPPPVEEAR